jgi:hypothetical protein
MIIVPVLHEEIVQLALNTQGIGCYCQQPSYQALLSTLALKLVLLDFKINFLRIILI